MSRPLLIVVAAFVASVLSGMVGMAGGIVLMGTLTWLLPVTTALALHGVIQLVSNLWRALLYHRHIRRGVLAWFGAGAVTARAVLADRVQPEQILCLPRPRAAAGAGVGAERWINLDASSPPQAVAAGFLSTALSLVSGVAGPITDLFFVRTRLSRHEVVATKAVMQPFGHASKILLYGAALASLEGRQAASPLFVGAALIASLTGIMVGGAILDRMSEAAFGAGGAGS